MKYVPYLSKEVDDIQAMLVNGFPWLHHSAFWLLAIEDELAFRQWLKVLTCGPWIRSVKDLNVHPGKDKEKVEEIAAIAFSYAGLMRLGLVDKEEFPFSTAFRSGMGSELRMRLLRDDPRTHWTWSDDPQPQNTAPVVHVLFAGWWKTDTEATFPQPQGVRVVQHVVGSHGSFATGHLTEPFGFREGISQPTIFGLKGRDEENEKDRDRDRDRDRDKDHDIAPGEFIMGHRNEYDELSYCANVESWSAPTKRTGAHFTLNGSYLAVRQIEQDVEAFNKMKATETGGGQCPVHPSIGEKMMGRRYDGAPLSWPASAPAPTDNESLNAFRYRVDDANGFITPRGAHIRRANPRDTLGHDVHSGIRSSKLHRLLRRGRPYAEADSGKVGTFFIACNTDLERQFEFIFQRWLRNPRFADLDHEDDPFLGDPSPPGGQRRKFTVPGLPTGTCVPLLTSLTTTVGGGYFFLPGLLALKFIANLQSPRATDGNAIAPLTPTVPTMLTSRCSGISL